MIRRRYSLLSRVEVVVKYLPTYPRSLRLWSIVFSTNFDTRISDVTRKATLHLRSNATHRIESLENAADDLMAHWLAAFAAVIVVYVTALCYFFLPSPFQPGSKYAKKHQVVCLLVLGDIGRSPRMLYHARSLSRAGFLVQIVGYKGAEPHASVLEDKNISYHFVPPTPDTLANASRRYFPLVGPLKVLHQVFFLLVILGYAVDPAAYLLVQNPPSVPSLAVARLMCWLRGTRLVVDWHNLGHTVLALRLSATHPLVKVAKVVERVSGARAHAHLTVTRAMRDVLVRDFRIDSGAVAVLYDRPPEQFRPLSAGERAQTISSMPCLADYDTARDRLVVSSTSWTADEDFGILLDALVAYDAAVSSSDDDGAPRILHVLVTGRGPMREHYLSRISALRLARTKISSVWLSAEDYPLLIGCADLGVSLHASTSGVDLPMKVLDMFGCGVPVLAKRFDALPELVKEGVNGRCFDDSADLAQMLEGLFATDGAQHLQQLKQGALQEGKSRWQENWDNVAAPIFVRR